MHPHIFISSTKKDISYCKLCSKLSYKGISSPELSLKTSHNFDIDPLKLKFKPFSVIANYNLPNHIKYLESKQIGISKIKYLVNTFGLKSIVLYKSINFMNQIFLEKEIPIENIENIASLCVLIATEFNDCCMHTVAEDYINKNEYDILYYSHSNKDQIKNNQNNNDLIEEERIKHKTNLIGLFNYIRKTINNYKYLELICLKYLNYDLGKYSAYDYIILFFELGIFFSKENIDIYELLKTCINILDFITSDKRSCDYNQYTLAMSIIKVTLENNVFFDKSVFKYIYGVDLSKKKYINCSNMIKNILQNLPCSIDNSKKLFYDNQLNINQQLLISIYLKYFRNKSNSNNNNIEENNNNQTNNFILNNVNIQNNYFNLDLFPYVINNNNIIINNNFINNNININNNNFYYKNCLISNCSNYFNNKNIGFNNNYFFYIKNLISQSKNFSN